MARTFVAASTQYAQSDDNPIVTDEPVSLGCAFRCDSPPASTQVFLFYGNDALTGSYISFGLTSSGFLEIWNRSGGVIYTGTTDLCDGSWHKAAFESWDQGGGVYRQNNYRDGSHVGDVDASGRLFHETFTRLTIGRADDSTPSQEFDGEIAEPWLAEQRCNSVIADIHSGAQTPAAAFGSNIRGWWKVLGDDSPEPDEVGGTALTLFNGPTKSATHPFTYDAATELYVPGSKNGIPFSTQHGMVGY